MFCLLLLFVCTLFDIYLQMDWILLNLQAILFYSAQHNLLLYWALFLYQHFKHTYFIIQNHQAKHLQKIKVGIAVFFVILFTLVYLFSTNYTIFFTFIIYIIYLVLLSNLYNKINLHNVAYYLRKKVQCQSTSLLVQLLIIFVSSLFASTKVYVSLLWHIAVITSSSSGSLL